MAKSKCVYLDDETLEQVERFAKEIRRSFSFALCELVRLGMLAWEEDELQAE